MTHNHVCKPYFCKRWDWCVNAVAESRGLSQDEARGIALEEILDRGLASLEAELAGCDEAEALASES